MFAKDDETSKQEKQENLEDFITRVNKVIEKHNWKPLKFVKTEDTPPPPKKEEGWDG